MNNRKAQIFLSYCWSDDLIADDIYTDLNKYPEIDIHRDKLNIRHWASIKEYMQSISDMDYTILLISDSYLKSSNCMYEVLEVMRDRKYKDKIFPAVICTDIYNPIQRAGYVKYWQEKYKELKTAVNGVDTQNLGTLTEDMKRYQNIAANIVEFIDTVADMNNPQIPKVADAIRKKLIDNRFIQEENSHCSEKSIQATEDLFQSLGIKKVSKKDSFTDWEINAFMTQSFRRVLELFEQLCKQYERENPIYTFYTEEIDNRNKLFQFYQNGMFKTGLKISLENQFGAPQIGISTNQLNFSNSHSWNGLYSTTIVDDELKLKAVMNIWGVNGAMTVSEVVRDIWEHYVVMYLQ